MSWAALLLAAAMLIGPRGRTGGRLRADSGTRPAARSRPGDDDALALAASLEVFASCLHTGMTVVAAASATADSAPPALSGLLSRAADLLALGADPQSAWSGAADQPQLETLQRLARRSAASGAALARGVAELAEQLRAEAAAAARADAERAGVLIAGPLGLCYLPAFVCLGIVPVVAGLVGDVSTTGMW